MTGPHFGSPHATCRKPYGGFGYQFRNQRLESGDNAATLHRLAERELQSRASGADLMARYDFRSPRLFVAAPLSPGATVVLDAAQTHYLASVLRLKAGDPLLIFNGMDGEWKAQPAESGRRKVVAIVIERQTRPQTPPGDLHYLFSPLKHARLDYMVQKAVEMGASRLQPVMMRHTHAERVNLERMRANAVEAAQQCGILAVPEIAAPVDFKTAIASLAPSRHLVFCDEEAPCADPVSTLRAAWGGAQPNQSGLAVIIRPPGR
jgi:16S rRNA (uracil1498-N3)-methyltransferase